MSVASLAALFSSAMTFLRAAIGSYCGSNPSSMSTPSLLFGRSRTWPIDASTLYSRPRSLLIVFAFAGDSTTTSDLAIDYLFLYLSTVSEIVRTGRPRRAATHRQAPVRPVAAAIGRDRCQSARRSRPDRMRRPHPSPATLDPETLKSSVWILSSPIPYPRCLLPTRAPEAVLLRYRPHTQQALHRRATARARRSSARRARCRAPPAPRAPARARNRR